MNAKCQDEKFLQTSHMSQFVEDGFWHPED